MTALAEAFAKSGLKPADAEFDIAIAKYLNSGGTIAGALQRINVAAERMSGMGQSFLAREGHPKSAQTRQQNEGGEAIRSMLSSRAEVASLPSSNRGGEGQTSCAPVSLSSRVLPVREPTQQQRAASAAAANVMAITIMDTLKIDGKSIGNWTVGEARKAGQLKTREGYILINAARVVANANGNELIRHVVKAKELQKIIQKAAEVADAV